MYIFIGLCDGMNLKRKFLLSKASSNHVVKFVYWCHPTPSMWYLTMSLPLDSCKIFNQCVKGRDKVFSIVCQQEIIRFLCQLRWYLYFKRCRILSFLINHFLSASKNTFHRDHKHIYTSLFSHLLSFSLNLI